ncbi:MAG: hypothetical protein ACPIOQ_12665, partial [Promethearchaeia archaeon]
DEMKLREDERDLFVWEAKRASECLRPGWLRAQGEWGERRKRRRDRTTHRLCRTGSVVSRTKTARRRHSVCFDDLGRCTVS